MHTFYSEFMKHLEAENREGSLSFVLSKLENNEIDIITLYTEILAPSLNNMKAAENWHRRIKYETSI